MIDYQLQKLEAYNNRLLEDFEFFAQECLQIVGKDGGDPVPFIFNDAQKYLHREIERMRRELGLVRIKGVKGRQQGFSSYVAGRFLWHAFRLRNVRVFILSHEGLSTGVLFEKVKFFYINSPELVRPGLITDNRQELKLTNGSQYKIATAGTEDTGRSQTAQFMHRSERAYYSHVGELDAGVGQIVSYQSGTEIIDESTGNGYNHYRQECLDAKKGIGRYRLVFVPWYWQREYREPVKPDFQPDDEEIALADAYGLDSEQLQWRRSTIHELKNQAKGGGKSFKQEYPCNLEEAFQASTDGFYDTTDVLKARTCKHKANVGAIIMGVDVGGSGADADESVISTRRGIQLLSVEGMLGLDDMQLTGIVANQIDYWVGKGYTVRCFIDAGRGYGVLSRLFERGYGRWVEGVHFGGKPTNPIFLNKRAEMNFDFRAWLQTPGGVNIPDDDKISIDVASMPAAKTNSNGRFFFPPKEDIKKELGHSPDRLDSICLTFSYSVADEQEEQYYQAVSGGDGPRRRSELTVLNDYDDNTDDTTRISRFY